MLTTIWNPYSVASHPSMLSLFDAETMESIPSQHKNNRYEPNHFVLSRWPQQDDGSPCL